jgi:hypothetical protein
MQHGFGSCQRKNNKKEERDAGTDIEIEHVRKLLPKIANGRKTRYQTLKEKQKPQPRAAVPHESGKKAKRNAKPHGQRPNAKSQELNGQTLTGGARCFQHRTRPSQIALWEATWLLLMTRLS